VLVCNCAFLWETESSFTDLHQLLVVLRYGLDVVLSHYVPQQDSHVLEWSIGLLRQNISIFAKQEPGVNATELNKGFCCCHVCRLRRHLVGIDYAVTAAGEVDPVFLCFVWLVNQPQRGGREKSMIHVLVGMWGMVPLQLPVILR
jgi:hypothetical protein